MGRSVKSTSGTRSGASHSLWREAIQHEGIYCSKSQQRGNCKIQQEAEAEKEVEPVNQARETAENFSRCVRNLVFGLIVGTSQQIRPGILQPLPASFARVG